MKHRLPDKGHGSHTRGRKGQDGLILHKPPDLTRTIAACLLLSALASCKGIDLFEKHVAIPGHAWSSGFQPEVRFEIKDTASAYRIFLLFRHTDAYGYNNLWVNLTSRRPGEKDSTVQRFEIPLATNEKWTGTGMGDVFEHRVLLYREPVRFRSKGTYSVRIEQLMREEPLRHAMNVGLRIEKSNP